MFDLKIQRNLKNIPIDEYFSKRNRILIHRDLGGAGDILMHRMIFEDFKIINPNVHITFAVPPQFFPLVKNHPFIDCVADFRTVDHNDYIMVYDTTATCLNYEQRMAEGHPPKNRPDIWAESCGVKLTKHNMHLEIDEKIKDLGHEIWQKFDTEGRPRILISPIAMSSQRGLSLEQYEAIMKKLQSMNVFILGTNINKDTLFDQLQIPQFNTKKIEEWMGLVSAADYVISVDTGTFHLAAGLKKPLLGLFTKTEGSIRGQNYEFVLWQQEANKISLENAVEKMFCKWPIL